MADTRTPEQHRRIMQSVKTRDTGPELTVRRILSGLGYRYRLNARKLPGRPDVVFPGRMYPHFAKFRVGWSGWAVWGLRA